MSDGAAAPTLRRGVLGLLLSLSVLAALAPAQEPERRELDFEEATSGASRFLPRPWPGLRWHPDGERVTHLLPPADPSSPWRLVERRVSGGEPRTLMDQATFDALAREAGLEDLKMSALAGAEWLPTGDALVLVDGGRRLRLALDPPALEVLLSFPAEAQASAFTRDGGQVAWVEGHDVRVTKRDGTVERVTRGGFEHLTHGLTVSRVEFGISEGLWWDPSGRRLAFYREDLRTIDPYPQIDFSTLPARRVPDRYPMAGTSNSVVSVGVYDSRDDSVVWLQTDPEKDEYLTNVAWGPAGDRIYLERVARSQDSSTLACYDAATGRHVADLFTEKDPQWVEPEHPPIFLPDGSGAFLRFSPRDGFHHLWLHAADGHLMQQVTKGAFDVAAFRGFDPSGTGFWFEASGEDPRQMHLFHARIEAPRARVAAGGAALEIERDPPPIRRVTPGRGRHTTLLSPGGRVLDVHSNLELPLAIDLLDADGSALRRLHEAPNPFTGWRVGAERFFTTETGDGQPLHGHLITPPDLDQDRKHPVLLWVYGGPHSQFVRDEWMGGLGGTNVWLHHMASLGFVVLRVDGRGTLNRGIDWVQTIHRRLGTVEIEDQLAGLDHVLGLGFADPARVGVHGWSYGGFMTLSLMTRAGDRFAAGVSGAPVTDWRHYETGYGERYMDRPEENPEGYDTADPGRHVAGLKGRLLLVHGSSDATVVWQNTIDFVSKCIAADADLDYFVYPGQLHGLRGASRKHFFAKMTRFFRERLLD